MVTEFESLYSRRRRYINSPVREKRKTQRPCDVWVLYLRAMCTVKCARLSRSPVRPVRRSEVVAAVLQALVILVTRRMRRLVGRLKWVALVAVSVVAVASPSRPSSGLYGPTVGPGCRPLADVPAAVPERVVIPEPPSAWLILWPSSQDLPADYLLQRSRPQRSTTSWSLIAVSPALFFIVAGDRFVVGKGKFVLVFRVVIVYRWCLVCAL